jgi:hypothetical protein
LAGSDLLTVKSVVLSICRRPDHQSRCPANISELKMGEKEKETHEKYGDIN